MDATGTPDAAPAPSTLAEQVQRVLAEAPKPLTAKQVKAAVDKLYPRGTKKAAKPSPTSILGELEKEGVFAHPATKNGELTYWRSKPQTAAEAVAAAVRAKVEALGDEPVTEAQLGKPGGKKATPEAAQAFADTIAELLGQRKLFQHGKAFGKHPPAPPKWYETEPGKKAFASLVTAAKKVLGLNVAPADEVIALLRERLGHTQPMTDRPEPAPPPQAASPSTPAPTGPTDLRASLKAAYDHLCDFVEFRDRLVELPRLYRETAKRVPGLTPEGFKDELWRMSDEREIQLHVLNEVREAQHPELAIHRNDRLYYYLIWN